ncbi:hypothetical protein BGZ61DRAFT_477926 [Ilyonectria robusta]|uniref:uncharacterized protein n=1 Tax=Ilyonectria robusta TaxID=1079257 RepID=UPI001E8E653B|nr:uncharacterized protein BGZ61DRAFT_477926 [Ilyonectria robusta]KAH8699979.1 hypothetical protein BGZ61DRAFT_477926 [Ilyonectria robusta]
MVKAALEALEEQMTCTHLRLHCADAGPSADPRTDRVRTEASLLSAVERTSTKYRQGNRPERPQCRRSGSQCVRSASDTAFGCLETGTRDATMIQDGSANSGNNSGEGRHLGVGTKGDRGEEGRRGAPRWRWKANSPGAVIAGLWGSSILHQSVARVPANAVNASLRTLGLLGLLGGLFRRGSCLSPGLCFMAMRPARVKENSVVAMAMVMSTLASASSRAGKGRRRGKSLSRATWRDCCVCPDPVPSKLPGLSLLSFVHLVSACLTETGCAQGTAASFT